MLSARVKLTKDGRIGTKDGGVYAGLSSSQWRKRLAENENLLRHYESAKGKNEKYEADQIRKEIKEIKEILSYMQDSKTKDDQSDAWQEKIRHIKEYLETYPDAPDAAKKKAEIKELEVKVAGTKDALQPNQSISITKCINIDLNKGDVIRGKDGIWRLTGDYEYIGDSKTEDGKKDFTFVKNYKGFDIYKNNNPSNNDINNFLIQKNGIDQEDASSLQEAIKSIDEELKSQDTKDSYYGITTGQEIGKHNGYKLSLHKLENDNWLVAQRRGETFRTNVGGSIDSAITKMKKIIDGYSTLIKSAEESGVTEDDGLPVGLHNDTPDEEFDAEQLQMGIEVEQEHTSDPEIAKAIAKDHLSEIKDYYTRLAKMEAEAGVKDCEKYSKTKDALYDVIINRSGENHTYNDIEANNEDHARTKCISSLEKKLGLVSGALQKEYDGSKLNVEVKKKKD